MSSSQSRHQKKFISTAHRENIFPSANSGFILYECHTNESSQVFDMESATRLSTLSLISVLKRCNPGLNFDKITTQHVLTSPATPVHNDFHDNAKYDYIIHSDDVIGTGVPGAISFGKVPNSRYRILSSLGCGAFGQVVKCFDEVNKKFVAIKVLKNRPAYYRQGMLEIAILQLLNEKYDKDYKGHTLRLTDHFVFHNHICIVTELLSINLYELMRQNKCRSLYVSLARSFLQQILDGLKVLYQSNIIHCDLKPENVLLVDSSKKINLIDFGSACFENSTLYTYIQSRHYRAPEVILGLPYSTAIDMWSLGCMAGEMFVGIPIFPGNSEYNMLYKFINFLGMPPNHLLNKGTKTTKFFRRKRPEEMMNSEDIWILKSKKEFDNDNNTNTEPNKEYFSYKSLEDIAMKTSFRVSNADEPRKLEFRYAFLDFMRKCLKWDPEERMRPDQALQHPFITKKPLPLNYTLPPTSEPLRTYPPGSQVTSEEALQRIAPNPSVMQQLKTMTYNCTSYYQIYSEGLNKGIVLNILNSNPFALKPMTPPSLIQMQIQEKTIQEREIQLQQTLMNNSMSFEGMNTSAIHQSVVKNQLLYKNFSEVKKDHSTIEKKMERKRMRGRQRSKTINTTSMEMCDSSSSNLFLHGSSDQQPSIGYTFDPSGLPPIINPPSQSFPQPITQNNTNNMNMPNQTASWSQEQTMIIPNGMNNTGMEF